MVLENLDRTQWSFAETHAHVEAVVLSCESEKFAHTMLIKGPMPPMGEMPAQWLRNNRCKARDEVLVALRDGDLHAQGRLSTTAVDPILSGENQWRLHSGHHQPISPFQWREGEFSFLTHKLTAAEWEFIDIRMPRFVVKAIWPDYVTEVAGAGEFSTYTPPYLELMQEAIVHFSLSDTRQEKKDVLVNWFLDKRINDAPLSKNLADAMATLVRLPSAQRGGAKRSFPPGYSRAS